MRILMPFILLAAAAGLFMLYTNPAYQASKALSTQVAAYDDALTKSQELKGIREKLLSKRNTFSESDVQKLRAVLPDNVDNIRFLIDINNIAARHSLSLTNVQLGVLANSADAQSAATIASTGSPVGSVDIGFTMSATYENMLAFLQDIEHSLRLSDVQKLGFTASPTGSNSYMFTLRTYWLR